MMEQQNISVQLKGINLSAPVDSGQDGICGHIVNLRFKDGAWRLAGEKMVNGSIIEGITDSHMFHINPVTGNNKIIGVEKDNDSVWIYDVEEETAVELMRPDSQNGEVVNDIRSFGKFLIVATNFTRYIYKYDNDDDGYVLVPDVPEGRVSFWDDERLPYKNNDGEYDYEQIVESLDPVHAVSALKKRLFDDGVDGYFEGHVFFRLAWRLFDNSLIHHSTIHYCHVGLFPQRLYFAVLTGSLDTAIKFYHTNNPVINIIFNPQEVQKIESLKGIVRGLVVFMSDPVSSYDFGENFENYALSFEDVGDVHQMIINKPPLKEDAVFDGLFKETRAFYNVAEYDVDDILTTWANISGTIAIRESLIIKNVHSITTRETMAIDNFTSHKFSANHLYDYNTRLHLSDVYTAFSEPKNNGRYQLVNTTDETYMFIKKGLVFGANRQLIENSTYTSTFYIEVDLETEDGSRFSRKVIPLNEHNANGITIYNDTGTGLHYLYLKEVITYPDIRAKYLRVCMKNGSDTMVVFGNELKEHPFFNLSYYQHSFNKTTPHNGFLSIISTPIPTTIIQDHIYRPINNILRDTNRVQASALGNIFVYPALNSYRIGQKGNTVIALASMSSPMSEGQFGAFPIHVFSESGIFTLNQGQGDILYSSVVRFNIDKLTSKNQLLELGGAIVYASRSGLYLLAGSQRKRISQALESKYGIESSSDYWGFPEGECRSALTMIDFETFMQGAVMAYNHVENEIIISNPTGMSYIFQIDTGSWYKSSQSFNDFVMKIDGSYLSIDSTGALSEVDSENTANDYSENICFVTRPMRLGNRGFKKIARLLGRMVFNVVSGSSVKMSVYGSLNGRDWELMRSVAFDDGVNDLSLNDIMIKDTHASAKYFIVSFKAVVGSDFEFTGMDMTVEPRFTRKLR